MVPLYRGTPCILRPVDGFVQSFVPFASLMKLATPIGAFFGKSVQVSFPAVVSMIAVGAGAAVAVAGFFGVPEVAGLVCDISESEKSTVRATIVLRMYAPNDDC